MQSDLHYILFIVELVQLPHCLEQGRHFYIYRLLIVGTVSEKQTAATVDSGDLGVFNNVDLSAVSAYDKFRI